MTESPTLLSLRIAFLPITRPQLRVITVDLQFAEARSMMNAEDIIRKAESSSFYRWLLNQALWRMIPFNGPHQFRTTGISKDYIELTIPYIRKNLNHIKGIHACALATACEYVSGLSLTWAFPPIQYRIILKTGLCCA